MTLRSLLISALALAFAIAPARADYVVLDGNRNPQTFKSIGVSGGQVQQTVPSDPTATPYSQTNPQYFNLLINGFLLSPGQQNKANSLPFVMPSDPDVRPTPATITAADTLTTTVTGQNGASIVTGSPSASSFLAQAVNGVSTARIQLSGSWVGTMMIEQSVDGGATYGAMGCHVNGTVYSASQVTGNGIFDCELAGATNFRVRASSFVGGGTAVLTETLTTFTGVVKIVNSVAIKDNASGSAMTIKPASTAPAGTDPAAVVSLSPNSSPSVTAPLGVTSTDFSGTITAGGSYQPIIAASGSRKGCLIQNPSTATEVLNVKFGTMASPFTLQPSQSISCLAGDVVLQDAITATAATNGHAFAATAQ
jgi:hypothetical protein